MGDLFKALTSGLAQFVYAWLMPSVVAVGIFVVVVLPQVPGADRISGVGGVGAFALSVFTLSIIFAYTSRLLYHFLEGYTMPRWLARRLLRRTRKRYVRLKARTRRGSAPSRAFATEALMAYPESPEELLPTRLGNALRGMEGYGRSRYGLDSQTFWYELQAVADDRVRQQTQEARAAVDFFMSSIAHLLLLILACLLAVPAAQAPLVPLVVAVVAAALVPAAYQQAVKNVGEWRFSIQALVNTSRPALAKALSLHLPSTFDAERTMWQNSSAFVVRGAHDAYLRALDPHRLGQAAGPAESGTSPSPLESPAS